MNFGRHRVQAQTTVKVETPKETTEKKDVVIEAIKEVFPKAVVTVIEAEEKKPAKKNFSELRRERVEKFEKKPRKKRVDKKSHNYVGIIGDTVECRDFRAIVKKKGEQINNVLSKILHDWNTANYNL